MPRSCTWHLVWRSRLGSDMNCEPKSLTEIIPTGSTMKKILICTVGGSAFTSAFLPAPQGFADGLSIHYPRTSQTPHPEGRDHEWLVSNERGPKLMLPTLGATDAGLPYKR